MDDKNNDPKSLNTIDKKEPGGNSTEEGATTRVTPIKEGKVVSCTDHEAYFENGKAGHGRPPLFDALASYETSILDDVDRPSLSFEHGTLTWTRTCS